MGSIILFLLILMFFFSIGTIGEKTREYSIKKRERALINKAYVNLSPKSWQNDRRISKIDIVTGEIVIGSDYFRSYMSWLLNFVGGNIPYYEKLLELGRREAILRIREKALWADEIINLRLESLMLSETYSEKTLPQCALIAYGTAVKYM